MHTQWAKWASSKAPTVEQFSVPPLQGRLAGLAKLHAVLASHANPGLLQPEGAVMASAAPASILTEALR